MIAQLKLASGELLTLNDQGRWECADQELAENVNFTKALTRWSPSQGEPGHGLAHEVAEMLDAEIVYLRPVAPAEPGLIY